MESYTVIIRSFGVKTVIYLEFEVGGLVLTCGVGRLWEPRRI